MNIFHILEIVEMGIEKEKKRRDFYAQVVRAFPEKEMKGLFERLRDWEEAHIKKFSQIRETLNEQETVESYPGELSVYMQSLVDERLYNVISPAEFSKAIRTPLDAVQRGIGFEKDAILFFNELASYTTDAHQEVITALIGEEKQHIVYLSELKAKLLSKK